MYGVTIGWWDVMWKFIDVGWGGTPAAAHGALNQAGGLASLALEGFDGAIWASGWPEGAVCGSCLGDSIGELREVLLAIPS